jgi:hypothetical protein
MQANRSAVRGRRGITVLTLLLLIIAVVVAAIFLVRYLRTRPAPVQTSAASVAPVIPYVLPLTSSAA